MRPSMRAAAVVIAFGLPAWPWAQSMLPSQSAQTSPRPARLPQAAADGARQDQRDPPVFRAGVELVQLDVSVLDSDRRPVTGLTASDFTVLEDGVERPIRAFTPVQLPAPSPAAEATRQKAISTDVATNQAGNQEGRLVFILMDRTIPLGQPTLVAKKVATAAVEALGPQDLAAVVTTSGGIPQSLTADRARLLAALNHGDWSTGISKEQEEVFGKVDPLSDGRCLCGVCVLDTVTRIANAVETARRRHKVLLFIGNSVIFHAPPRDMKLDTGCDSLLTRTRQRMFDALALSSLTVHSIDPAGLVNIGAHTRAGAGGGKPGGDAQAIRRQKLLTDTNDHLTNQNSLAELPSVTGGRVVLNTNGPEEKVPEIFAESSSYYVLAFEPVTAGAQDSKRAIEVRVGRRGVRVHTQRHFTSQPSGQPAASAVSRAGVSAPLQQALQGVLPTTGRPLTMALAAFAGSGGAKALVTINVDVGAFAVPDGKAVPLDFAVSALNRFGRQVASARQTSTITFHGGAEGVPVEANVQTQIELEPGDYELRVAVADPARTLVASVYSEVAIPAFGSTRLSLSDLTVETSGRETRSAASTPGPTTRRVFDPEERVRALLQVYQGTERREPILPVSVRARIADASGRLVRDQQLQLTEKQFANRRAGIALDIDKLPAGQYVLTVDASMARQTAARALQFAVR